MSRLSRVSGDSRQTMMIELLRDHPELMNAKESCAAFQQRYKMPVNQTTYYHAKKAILNGHVLPKEASVPAPEVKDEVVFPVLAEHPFVPSSLLENVAPIKKACDSAGGLETAQKLAEVIQRAGGVENFLAAVELLRRINEPVS